MDKLLLAGLAGALLVGAVLAARSIGGRLRALLVTQAGKAPFEVRPVMNRGEHEMFERLRQAAPPGLTVLAQVPLSSFLQVRGLKDREERWLYLNRIIRLSVDFLLVDATNMRPVLGIELDGPSHRGIKSLSSGQLDADTRKTQAFEAAGLRLVRFRAGSAPSSAQLQEVVQSCRGY